MNFINDFLTAFGAFLSAPISLMVAFPPVGIVFILSTALGLLLCRRTNWKVFLLFIGFSFFMVIIGILANSEAALWLLIIFVPSFVGSSAAGAFYYGAKLYNKIKQKRTSDRA